MKYAIFLKIEWNDHEQKNLYKNSLQKYQAQ